MRNRYFGTFMSLVLASALLAGCGEAGKDGGNRENVSGQQAAAGTQDSEESNASAGDETSVIVAMGPSSEPEAGFDPAYGWGAGEHVHEPLIQSTLTVTNPDLSIGYDLATDMQVSEDGMTWTVTIRDDVKFTDGEPLTAKDVAFTYNTVKENSSVNDFTMLDEAVAAVL